MSFCVTNTSGSAAVRRSCVSRFKQTTALISATLLFCLPLSLARADIIYYNYANPVSGTADPRTGGVWEDRNSNTNWIGWDAADEVLVPGAVPFDGGDDVRFRSSGDTVIEIDLHRSVDPTSILVEDGEFEFNAVIGENSSLQAASMTVLSAGRLNLDVNTAITPATANAVGVDVQGTLLVRVNRQLSVTGGGIEINNSGDLIVGGEISGNVALNDSGTINFGPNGSLIGQLDVYRTDAIINGNLRRTFWVYDGASATLGGTATTVNWATNNYGTLSLREGTYNGALYNGGTVNLLENVTFSGIESSQNYAGGVIEASGDDRTLTITGALDNSGRLSGGVNGDTLTIQATRIVVRAGSQFTGNVILSGAIENRSNFDLAYAPVLRGTFTNADTGVLLLADAADNFEGNQQNFVNQTGATLRVEAGSLTNLDELRNEGGTVQVLGGGTLGANSIIHGSGIFNSAGTLNGAVVTRAAAGLRGEINGSLTVEDATTTVTGALDLSGSTGGGLLTVAQDGTLLLNDAVTVTAARLVNQGTVNLGVGGVVDGDLTSQGTLTGTGRVTGDLIFTGGGSLYEGTSLTVQGAIVNDRNGPLLISQITGITAGELINRSDDGALTINAARTINITNEANATLELNQTVTGNVTSYGTTNLRHDVVGRLVVADGLTRIGVPTLGLDTPVTVGGASGLEARVEAGGELRVIEGDLTATGNLRASGRLDLRTGRTLTAGTVIIDGSDAGVELNSSLLSGAIVGNLTVTADGTATLSGLTVSGTTVNNGTVLTGPFGGPIVLQNRFVNRGTAILGTAGNVAQIQGQLVNHEDAVATVFGNVTANSTNPGTVINRGELTLTGNVTSTVSNESGELVLTGNMGRLVNAADGDATVVGDVGTAGTLADLDVVNNGDLILTGDVANSLQNQGNLTFSGTVGGNLLNNGTGIASVSGTVGLAIRNNASQSIVNITGDTTAANLVNVGTVNVTAGNDLSLSTATLNNVGGARLNVSGTLGHTDAGTVLNVQNARNGVFAVTSTGTLDGDLTNNGVANIGGSITGNVVNNDNGPLPGGAGVLNLWTVAEIDGSVTNGGIVNATGGDASTGGTAHVVVSGGLINTNGGTVNVTGALAADVDNQSGAMLSLDAGKITGIVTNRAGGEVVSASGLIVGGVQNYGTFSVDLDSFVEGNFYNYENALITQVSGISSLMVDGVLTNEGTISTGDFASFIVGADRIINSGTLIGDVRLTGDVSNNGRIIYNRDITLTDDLESGGTVRVWATVTGDGDNAIINNGLFDVSRGGELLNVASVENNNLFTIDSGSRVQAGSFENNAGGALTNGGIIESDLINRAGAELVSTGVIRGNLDNYGTADLSGTITGNFQNFNAPGTTTDVANVVGNLAVGGNLANRGTLETAAGTQLSVDGTLSNLMGATMDAGGTVVTGTLLNNGALTLRNGMRGNLQNNNNAQVAGTVTGNVTNTGTAALSGRITGVLTNAGTTSEAADRIDLTGNLRVGSVVNAGGALVVEAGRTLTVDGDFENRASGRVALRGNTVVGGTLIHSSNRQLVMSAAATLTGDLRNEANALLNGTINGNVLNQGPAEASGRITGTLINEGARFATNGDLVVQGAITNRPHLVTGGSPIQAPGAPTTLVVTSGTTLTAGSGLTNQSGATTRVAGNLVGDVLNQGVFRLENSMTGDLTNQGSAFLAGELDGNLTFAAGSSLDIIHATQPHELTVTGIFDAFNDFTVSSEDTLNAGRYINRIRNELTVAGTMTGLIENNGTLIGVDGGQIGSLANAGSFFVDGAFDLSGAMANNGTVDMTRNGSATDVLTVNGGISGSGAYALDLDMNAAGGAGASDRVVVRGGPATGSIVLGFNDVTADLGASDASKRVLVFDVDESYGAANDFVVSEVSGLPAASERIVYAVVREGGTGDLYMTDAINPALGALSGNLALTQSLIGSVVNRPSSPFVPGLAGGAGDKPCGVGGWARALAGHASAKGKTTSGAFSVASSIEADYRGLQFGGDLACFEGSVSGWNAAFGVIGGVNDGTTTQPVYVNDPTDPTQLSDVLGSINDGDFRQIYGGIYATASRERWFLDLQIRRERTEFTIDNQPVGTDNLGLQLRDSGFDSHATTVSGAVSYAYTLPREGWIFVPTAGFAFSNLSVDRIYFVDGSELQIEDSKNRVGFIGGTLSKTFLNQERKSIINAYGTATLYKDFAPETASVFTLRDGDGAIEREDGLTSSNLGTYGELSLGVNYSKVLEAGSAGKPRQFNASVRVDGRTGDVLDSYGITAQVRLQF